MIKKKIKLFLAGLGIAMMAPGQIVATEESSTEESETDRTQVQIPATIEAAVRCWGGVAWYDALTPDQKQGAGAYYNLIERGTDVSKRHHDWVKGAVKRFRLASEIHQFQMIQEFRDVVARLPDVDAAEFFYWFWESVPMGKLSENGMKENKYYFIAMKWFSQLPEGEQNVTSMAIFHSLYDADCSAHHRRHKEKVRWRMIWDELAAGKSVNMADVQAIFKKTPTWTHLARGLVERGPKEAGEIVVTGAMFAVFVPLSLLFPTAGLCV